MLVGVTLLIMLCMYNLFLYNYIFIYCYIFFLLARVGLNPGGYSSNSTGSTPGDLGGGVS